MIKKISLVLLFSVMAFGQKENKAPSQPVTDIYFGKEIIDEYRNFENQKDTTVLNWIKSQSKYSQNVLNQIKNKENYLMLLDKLVDKRYDLSRSKPVNIPKQQNILYKLDNKDSLRKLYYRSGPKKEFKVFFSPKEYQPDLKINYYINYYKLSPNNRYVAISLTKNGQEISDVIIYDLKNKKLLKDCIKNTWVSNIGGINWLKDETGFIYAYLPVTDKISPDFIKNSEAVLYKLGSKAGEHTVLFSKKNNPDISINSNDFCIAFESDKYWFVSLSGAEKYNDYYYAEKQNGNTYKLLWKPLFKKSDKIKTFKIHKKQFVFQKEINGLSCLLKTDLENPNFNSIQPFVQFPENEIIKDFGLTKKGIYISTVINGVIAKFYIFQNKLQEINLPMPAGFLSVKTYHENSNDIWLTFGSWNTYPARYKYSVSKDIFKLDNSNEPVYIPEFEDIDYEELTIKTHDGLDLPLTIIYKKGIQKDGSNRVLMTGYGAYGISTSPYYDPYSLIWVHQGGVLVQAHVRGGGEKGEFWRLGGYKTTKENSWKDFISSAEFLIANGYTKPERLGVTAGSAGGVLVGRAITERPDLFKAALIDVGILNALRFELSPNGENNIKEFGTIKIKEEFESLYKMDPFHHIKKGVSYPASLITSGMNDNRVVYWQPAKFAAKLMEFNSNKNPILYLNDYESGHGENSIKKEYEQLEMINNFFNWQLGNPDYN